MATFTKTMLNIIMTNGLRVSYEEFSNIFEPILLLE
jgi:hypothetical protein